MKKDEFYERFLFVPIIVMVVSVLGILFNGYARAFPKEEEPVEFVEEVASEETSTRYKPVKKITPDEKPVDINHASVDELQRLPGIGGAKADAIVRQREKMGGFRTLEDLMCTDGIGTKLFEKLKMFIKISN